MKEFIVFKNVDLGYKTKKVLENINLIIKENDFLGILGPNGSGKTTLIRSVLQIIPILKGNITFSSQQKKTLRFGYVPQKKELNPLLPITSFDMIMMALTPELGIWKKPTKKQKERVFQALKVTNMDSYASTLYQELSGGQQQRILIARSVVVNPDILILDEPTNDMDIVGQKMIMKLLKQLHQKGIVIIIVSHLINILANYCDSMAIIHNKKLQYGVTSKIITNQSLSSIYGVTINVDRSNGKYFIEI